MPKFSAEGASNMLDGLKSRLGFNRGDEDFYDDYEDGYEDDYDGPYEDDYVGYNDEPEGSESYRSSSSSSSRSSHFGRGESAADNLVSIDDVRAHSAVSDRYPYDSRAAGSYASSSPSSSSYGAHAQTSGVDSLFDSTETPTFTPYNQSDAYKSSYTTRRALTVLKPVVYGDVESVAASVRAGDVVVLAMYNTPEALSMRILDFAFGVASALEANVENAGDKVFAIARGDALTEDEKASLRSQGVL